jgi:hypothetical protein
MRKFARIVLTLSTAAAIVALALLFGLDVVDASAGVRETATATNASTHGDDVYFFGRDAKIETPVRGNVQVYAGNAVVDNVVGGDLVVFGGNITVRAPGRVEGNVIYAGGTISGGERVGGHVYPLTTLQGTAAVLSRSAVIASLLLVWLVAAVVLTLLGGREIRFSSLEVRASALHSLILGLVGFTSFVITAVVFSFLVPYVVGIPLLAFLALFAILTKVYGMISVFHAVGSLLAAPRSREQLVSRRWLHGDLAMVVLGVLVLGAIRLIPVVGTITWSVASIFGIGVALSTRFGRREPAFLAWRPDESFATAAPILP